MDAAASTSIFVFQKNESLAGFASRCGHLTEIDFLAQHPDPFLLTSMPTEPGLASWSVMIPVRKRRSETPADPSAPKQVKLSQTEVAAFQGRIYLGRGPECDIVLAPKSISRKHAVFERRAGVWHVVDLGSTNGTRIEGKVLAAKTLIALRSSPVKIEFGTDATLWFMLPSDVFSYMSVLTQTSGNELACGGDTKTDNRKMSDDKKTPVDNSFVARLEPPPSPEQVARSEAETGSLVKPSLLATWHDEDTDEKPSIIATKPAAPPPPRPTHADSDEKLLAAIRAIAALDSLIMTVSVQLMDSHVIVVYSPQSEGKVTDVADQILRLGPLIKSVSVTLSTARDGRPVEIYSSA
jgi:hypothetical protein